jgi:hypothetical protein
MREGYFISRGYSRDSARSNDVPFKDCAQVRLSSEVHAACTDPYGGQSVRVARELIKLVAEEVSGAGMLR